MQKLKTFLKPTKSKITYFLVLFIAVEGFFELFFRWAGTVTNVMRSGFPFVIYQNPCHFEQGRTVMVCTENGFYPVGLALNIALFYWVTCLIKNKR